MSEGYPMLVLPGYEMYQLAHIATFVADGLRGARTASDPQARTAAEQRLAGGPHSPPPDTPATTASDRSTSPRSAKPPACSSVPTGAPTSFRYTRSADRRGL